jgi:hypothetical protein
MKQVFSSPDSSQIGLAQSLLDGAGIACEVRNDRISQAIWKRVHPAYLEGMLSP